MSMYRAALMRARINGVPAPLAHLSAFVRFIAASPDRVVFFGCVVLFAVHLSCGGRAA